MAKQMTWYVAILKATYFADKEIGYTEVARIGPFTTNQLESILKKLRYRKTGAIRIHQSSYLGQP